jgi:hypothetical protein
VLRETIMSSAKAAIVIYNGDILHDNGLNDAPNGKDSLFIRQLLDVVKDIKGARVFFTPGDLDWNNSGANGWEDVQRLESLINGIAGKEIFLPGDGCPGPVTIDFGNALTIGFINSRGGFILMTGPMRHPQNAMCWWNRNSWKSCRT